MKYEHLKAAIGCKTTSYVSTADRIKTKILTLFWLSQRSKSGEESKENEVQGIRVHVVLEYVRK